MSVRGGWIAPVVFFVQNIFFVWFFYGKRESGTHVVYLDFWVMFLNTNWCTLRPHDEPMGSIKATVNPLGGKAVSCLVDEAFTICILGFQRPSWFYALCRKDCCPKDFN